MQQPYYVYILASRSRNLYTGVTNNLERRSTASALFPDSPNATAFSASYITKPSATSA